MPGTTVAIPSSGQLLVRTTVKNDSTYEGAETFALKASYTTNTATNAAANTSIIDDGTGTRYPGTITSGSPSTSTTSLDDDRAIAVTAYGPINEASQYAMFTVTAIEGYKLDLQLQAATSGTAATRGGFTFEYSTDGSNWTTYTWNGSTGDQPTVPASGKVYVMDRENTRWQVFTLDGEFVSEVQDVNRPCDVAVDADGIFHIVGGGGVEIWTADGTRLGRVFLQELLKLARNHRFHRRFHLGGDQFILGLR